MESCKERGGGIHTVKEIVREIEMERERERERERDLCVCVCVFKGETE